MIADAGSAVAPADLLAVRQRVALRRDGGCEQRRRERVRAQAPRREHKARKHKRTDGDSRRHGEQRHTSTKAGYADDALRYDVPRHCQARCRLRLITDRDAWNRFVEARPTGNITQTFEWGELGARCGRRCLRLGASAGRRAGRRDAGDGRARAAAAAVRISTCRAGRWWTIRTVPRSPRCARGPAAGGASARRIHAQGRAERRWTAMRRGSAALRQAGLPAQSVRDASAALVGAGYHARARSDLLAGMKEKWRYNIRLAGRKGVQVREASSDADIDTFYALYQETAARDGIFIHPKEHYADVPAPLWRARRGGAAARGVRRDAHRRADRREVWACGDVHVRRVIQPRAQPHAQPPAPVDGDPLGEGARLHALRLPRHRRGAGPQRRHVQPLHL